MANTLFPQVLGFGDEGLSRRVGDGGMGNVTEGVLRGICR